MENRTVILQKLQNELLLLNGQVDVTLRNKKIHDEDMEEVIKYLSEAIKKFSLHLEAIKKTKG